jgi:purine-binding chemotaxis protein CheW
MSSLADLQFSTPEDEGIFAIRGKIDGDNEPEFSEREQLIGLNIANEVFLLDITYVNEIVMLEPIRYVPRAPKYIEGVVNLRGIILPTINMRKMLGHPRGEVSLATRIVIVKYDSQLIGLLVDGISTVVALLPSEIEEKTLAGKGLGMDLISKISKRQDQILGILDLEKILHVASEGRFSKVEHP